MAAYELFLYDWEDFGDVQQITVVEVQNFVARLEAIYRDSGLHERIDLPGPDGEPLTTYVDEGGRRLWRDRYRQYRREGKPHELACRLIESEIDRLEGRPDRWATPTPEPGPTPTPRLGRVRLAGKSLADDAGLFYGLGFTDFQSVRNRQFDPVFDDARTSGMAALGYNYRRIFGCVGWNDLDIGPQHDWHWDALDAAIWTPFVRDGVRTLLTIGADVTKVFSDADGHVSREAVRRYYRETGERVRPRADAILAFEGCNEPEANNNWPFDAAFLKECVELAAQAAGVAVYGPGAPPRDDHATSAPYRGQPVWYAHTDRSWAEYWEQFFRIARQARGPQEHGQRWINGEPAGPESTGPDLTDPQILFDIQCSALLCDAVATCYHSRAGTGNRGKRDLLASPGVREAALVRKYLPDDIATWEYRNHTHHAHPFRFVDPVGDPMGTIDGSKRGVIRAFSKVKHEGQFIVQALGVPGGATWEAVNRCRVRVIQPLSGAEQIVDLPDGGRLDLEPAPRADDGRPVSWSYLIAST